MKKLSLSPVSRHELRHIKGGGKPVAANCPNASCSIIFDCPLSCHCNGANICVSGSGETFPTGTSF